ncbi:MAG: hypothetical protein FWC26_00760, partial [Fibromonadales bacterium]|nr:hypothetical protein [Fibromonadales bacterium]
FTASQRYRAATYAAGAANAMNNVSDFQRVIIGDIDAIKNPAIKGGILNPSHTIKESRPNTNDQGTGLYGSLWNDFQEDLRSVGCGYWAQFYKNLFK